jgi:hypothetical protein
MALDEDCAPLQTAPVRLSSVVQFSRTRPAIGRPIVCAPIRIVTCTSNCVKNDAVTGSTLVASPSASLLSLSQLATLRLVDLERAVAEMGELELCDIIRAGLEQGRLSFVSQLAKALASRHFHSAKLQEFQRTLAPGRVTPVDTRANGDTAANMQWCSSHSHLYRGQWVALSQGHLLACGKTLREVRQSVGPLDSYSEPPLFFKIPEC